MSNFLSQLLRIAKFKPQTETEGRLDALSVLSYLSVRENRESAYTIRRGSLFYPYIIQSVGFGEPVIAMVEA